MTGKLQLYTEKNLKINWKPWFCCPCSAHIRHWSDSFKNGIGVLCSL